MPTYTNLGIKQITTGDEAGTWGTSTNTNFSYFDTAIVGYVSIALTTAGTTGSPNTLDVAQYAASNGRNRLIEYTSATDLGATCYVQITPATFYGYYFVKNTLAGGRDLVIFQGTYAAGRAITIANGEESIIRCDGAGTPTVYRVLNNFQNNSLVTNNILSGTTAYASLDQIQVGSVDTVITTPVTGTVFNGISFRYDAPTTATTQQYAVNVVANGGNSGSAYTTTSVAGFYVGDYGLGTNQTVTTQYGLRTQDLTSGTANYGAYLPVSAGTSKFTIYTGTADAQFNGQTTVGGQNRSLSKLVTNGADAANLYSGAITYTYTGAGTTGSHAASNVFGIVTQAALNATTYTNASTIFVNGPPAAGSNVTIGTTYSIFVSAGNVKVNDLFIGGYSSTPGATDMGFNTNNVVKKTPTATATYTTTVPPAGTVCNLIISTSGTTSYTITFGTGFSATATLATGTVSGKLYTVNFVSDGTSLIETGRTGPI